MILDFELFRHIIKEAKPLGLRGVKLTGGEPLMHPDISKILEFIRKEEIWFIIETDGTCCTPTLAREIRKSSPKNVSVNIYGADAETHDRIRGVEGSFDSAIKGIKNLVNAGCTPHMMMPVMNRNKDQIEDVVNMSELLGASLVQFKMVMPASGGDRVAGEDESIGVDQLITIGRWVNTELSGKVKIRLHYTYPYAFLPFSRMYGENVNKKRCGLLGILGVLSDGSYTLCGTGESFPELIFGHAGKDQLEDVWCNTELLNRLRQEFPYKLEGVCSTCVMKRICNGSCIALNYYRHKNLWAPFWFCEDAERLGLFPVSRQRRL